MDGKEFHQKKRKKNFFHEKFPQNYLIWADFVQNRKHLGSPRHLLFPSRGILGGFLFLN